ncbi:MULTISPECIES: DinB family protein [unclassified Crossiella]|uniref:DinB family protein n=1 Tax=unclassified Crossiella TaxID=2620835 RepID=UPI001FFF77C3|nr:MULTISPECIES: DinB family protein [unclassified Crossiella]MCK2238842.1 DinB family protein [Crossiella sp. S99.2]MCK2251588.1 DinB family protein [Crossiella sp. S99.1]
MTAARVELLLKQLDIAWSLFEHHLTDLDDAACLWEPAPSSWSVRPDQTGTWHADWAEPEPSPAPPTTIGWLTWHIGFWWTTTHGHVFANGAPPREQITWPGTAESTITWLRGLKDTWRASLLPLTDAELDSKDRTATLPWGPDFTLIDIAGWVTVELTKNVAEIGQLRHLHQARTAR